MGRINVRVQPNARRSELVEVAEGVLRIKVAAPAVEGKANQELIAFLAAALGVRKSAISLVRGATSREKVIEVDSLDSEAIIERLLERPR